MNKRRVLIIEDDSLFGDGVEQLLAQQQSIEIIGTVSADFKSIVETAENGPAEVLVINETLTKTHAHLIWQILKAHPQLQIIVLSLEDNRLSVLNNQEVSVTTSADLISTIVAKSTRRKP